MSTEAFTTTLLPTCEPSTSSFNDTLSDDVIRQRVTAMRWYAPVDFGHGIEVRPWNWPHAALNTPQMGAARYEFILGRNLPSVLGKRVLDIGCNAGLMSLHLARLGAREVIGVDSGKTWPDFVEQSALLKQVFEWRAQTTYNVRYIDSDMRDLSKLDLGRFDVVLALCCIYYLDDGDVANLVRYLSNVTEVLLLQGNTCRGDHRANPAVRRRAHPRFLRRVLQANGFPVVTVDAPWMYGRPVVVGSKSWHPAKPRGGWRGFAGKCFAKLRYLPLKVAGLG